jgi:hypothetical protein
MPLSAQADSHGKADHSRASGQFENRVAWLRREALDQPLRDRSSHAFHVGVALVPASCHRVPDRVAGAFVLTRAHGGNR